MKLSNTGGLNHRGRKEGITMKFTCEIDLDKVDRSTPREKALLVAYLLEDASTAVADGEEGGMFLSDVETGAEIGKWELK